MTAPLLTVTDVVATTRAPLSLLVLSESAPAPTPTVYVSVVVRVSDVESAWTTTASPALSRALPPTVTVVE